MQKWQGDKDDKSHKGASNVTQMLFTRKGSKVDAFCP